MLLLHEIGFLYCTLRFLLQALKKSKRNSTYTMNTGWQVGGRVRWCKCEAGKKEGAAVHVIKGESGRKTRASGGKNGELTEKQSEPDTRAEAVT